MRPEDTTTVEAKQVVRRNRLEALKYLLIVLTFIAVGASLLLITLVLLNVQQSSDVIIDCTTPGGQCYEHSNDRSQRVVSDINEVTILAASCARQPENNTEDEIRACIIAGLDD